MRLDLYLPFLKKAKKGAEPPAKGPELAPPKGNDAKTPAEPAKGHPKK